MIRHVALKRGGLRKIKAPFLIKAPLRRITKNKGPGAYIRENTEPSCKKPKVQTLATIWVCSVANSLNDEVPASISVLSVRAQAMVSSGMRNALEADEHDIEIHFDIGSAGRRIGAMGE